MTPTNRPSHREAMEAAAKKDAKDRFLMEANQIVYEQGFIAGADWQYEQDKARIEKLEAALQRLTKVGPPSRSCTGLEYAQVCLEDNCRIAIEALERP